VGIDQDRVIVNLDETVLKQYDELERLRAIIDQLRAEVKRLQAMGTECKLIHCPCAACGQAIHQDGGCGCEDNHHHPIADTHADQRSQLTAAVALAATVLPDAERDVCDPVGTMQRVVDQVAALRAIVDQLRKTDDGVPMVNGMMVWCTGAAHWENGAEERFNAAPRIVRTVLEDTPCFTGRIYSTQEAAEAAEEGTP